MGAIDITLPSASISLQAIHEFFAREVSEGLGAMWSGLASSLTEQQYLAVGPLVTINAVGVALMTFAFDQRIKLMDQSSNSRDEWKTAVNFLAMLDGMVIAGFLNLSAMLLILGGRIGCDEACPVPPPSLILAWATLLTIFSVLIVLISSSRGYAALIPLPPGRAIDKLPSIKGDPGKSDLSSGQGPSPSA